MSWAHALSRHLAYWHECLPTINGEDNTMIFSGSRVIDKTNSSGFGRGRTPPQLVPIQGHFHPQIQPPDLGEHKLFILTGDLGNLSD